MMLPKKLNTSPKVAMAAFVVGFLAVASLLAKVLSAMVYRFGIFVSPKFLIIAGMIGFMVVIGFAYIRAWKGFLLLRLSAKPNISISQDVMGLKLTSHPSVVETDQGLRAIGEIKLPLMEGDHTERQTQRALRILFRHPVVSALLFQNEGKPLEHKVDPGVEVTLEKVLRFDNERLATLSSRGATTLQFCIQVEDIQGALDLAEESSLIRLVPWQNFAKPFKLFLSGAVSESGQGAARVPAVVENEAGIWLPLLVTDYENAYQHHYNHGRFHDLSVYLGRPLVWHYESFPLNKRELGRIKRVATLESAFPSVLVDQRVRQHFKETPQNIEHLEGELSSARKPRLLKQILWVQLREKDQPRVFLAKAREWLFEQHLIVRGLTPTRALASMASLYPGLERHSADTTQGLGLAGGEDEISREMEALSQWQGHENGLLMLQDTSGKTVPFSLFEGGNNYNMVIVGEPGSGKSVVINGLCASHLARSRYNKAILVDYGGSFSGLVEASGGLQISYKDRARFTISPLPVLHPALEESAFSAKYPGESYQEYLAELELLQVEMVKQSLMFIKGYLCTRPVEDNGVFRETFFQLVRRYALPGKSLERIIDAVVGEAGAGAKREQSQIKRTAFQDMVSMFEEMASVCKISPFIGDQGLQLRNERLVSFNLDGFPDDEKNILVGLISLLIHQIFGERTSGKTMIVFDEVHKFIHTGALGQILDSTSRVTRKYGASLVLASQSPSDYGQVPSLIENANHHVIMRLKTRALSPEWKLTRTEILDHARTATPPADAVGYSTLHLGTTTKSGDLQGVFTFHFTPLALYPFTSKLGDKAVMDLSCHLTGIGNYIDLAERVHEDSRDTLIPVGDVRYWEKIEASLLPAYQVLRGQLLQLFTDPEVNPFLDLFLKGETAVFERVAKDAHAFAAFKAKHYEVNHET